MSVFAQKVLEDTEHLIAQKIWRWQLVDKLSRTDDASTLLLAGSNYPITQPFSSMSLFVPLTHRSAHVQPYIGHAHALGPQGTPGHTEGKKNQGSASHLPLPPAYGVVFFFFLSFDLLITFQA